MDITSATINLELIARSRATQAGTTGTMTIGDRIAKVLDCDVAYSFRVVSAAAGNVATLTSDSGIVAQTTGSPVITDGDGNDWEGKDNGMLTTSAQLAVLVVADEGNTGQVACVSADLNDCPSATLRAGGFVLLCQPNGPALASGATLAMTFAAAGSGVTVYVLGRIVLA